MNDILCFLHMDQCTSSVPPASNRRVFSRFRAASGDLATLLLSVVLTRREYLKLSTLAAAATAFGQTPADHTLTIAPYSFEYKLNRFIKTIAYNQQVPGPMLRLREGQPVSIAVVNNTANEEAVHWHGLQ